MKRSYRGVIYMCIMLLMNIIFTQQTVNAFFYEKYERVLLFAALNLIVFPIAIFIYRREREVK